MKTNFLLVSVAFVALTVLSCAKEDFSLAIDGPTEPAPKTKHMTFTAIADNSFDTKTSLDGYEVSWAANEDIYIFDGIAPRAFTSDNATAATVVNFTGEASSALKYYAIYPSGTINGSVITTSIPVFQEATANSFAPKSNVAVAYTTSNPTGDNVLHFKNIGAVVKFKLSNSDVRKVRIDAIGKEKMTGAMTVTFDGGGNFTTSMINAQADTSAILQSATDLSTSNYYYLVINPTTYSKGFRITLSKADGSYKTLKNTTSNTLDRNKIMDLGTLPEITTWKTPSTEYQKVTDTKDFVAGEYLIISYDESYYLPNSQATGNPALGSVTKTEGVINVIDAMKWTATATATGLQFKSKANTNYYLWGGSANDAVRVNNTSTKASATKDWKAYKHATYGVIAYAYSTKYLATNGTSDWRNYETPNATNRAANFYRLVTVGAPDDPPVGATTFEITSKSSASVAATDGTGSFVVHSNIPWTLSVDDESFITYSTTPTDATHTTVSISFDDLDGDDRDCTFTIVPDEGDSENVKFTQSKTDKETISISSYYSNGEKVTGSSVDANTSKTMGGIDFTFTRKNSGSQSYYDGSVIRFYKDDMMKMDASKNMKKIVFTMTSGYAALSPSVGSITDSSYSKYTWEGNASSVTFTASAQSRFSAIEITY